jgi:hypothetical protein
MEVVRGIVPRVYGDYFDENDKENIGYEDVYVLPRVGVTLDSHRMMMNTKKIKSNKGLGDNSGNRIKRKPLQDITHMFPHDTTTSNTFNRPRTNTTTTTAVPMRFF